MFNVLVLHHLYNFSERKMGYQLFDDVYRALLSSAYKVFTEMGQC